MTNVIEISKAVQCLPEEICDVLINELEVLGDSEEPVLYLPFGLVAIFDPVRDGYKLVMSPETI
jgi:hypothetical protein